MAAKSTCGKTDLDTSRLIAKISHLPARGNCPRLKTDVLRLALTANSNPRTETNVSFVSETENVVP